MNTFPRVIALIATLFLFTLSAAAQPAAGNHKLYMPMLATAPLPPSSFGLEMFSITADRGLDLALTSGTDWIRRNALLWKLVEPTEGAGYRWDAPEIVQLETELIAAAQNNINVILIIRGSPRWAVAPFQVDCAPINSNKYDAFARFVAAAVERYSKPPYNVMYWEIGNEPDAPLFGTDRAFGCWGDPAQEYFGGEAYGRLLNTVAPAIRAANPRVSILNGGLLLDRPYDPATGEGKMARFFEGMLRVDADESFDILSFHSYTYYAPGSATPLGLSIDWRVKYLRDLEKKYNVAPKPMMRTEAALLCWRLVSAECRWGQADFVGRLYARSARDGIMATIWYIYDNDSHHNTALIDPGDVFSPRPAYYAYRNAAQLIGDATYRGPITELPETAEGYRFQRGGQFTLIAWSDQNQMVSLTVPENARVRCIERDGATVPCTNQAGKVTVYLTPSPFYVVYR